MTDRLKHVNEIINQAHLARVGFETFRSMTPVRTGNAKSNTTLSGNRIMANYAYAMPLDNGSSKKAPQGMTVPMIQVLREHIHRQLGIDLKRGAPSIVIGNNASLEQGQREKKLQALNQTNTSQFVKSSIPVGI